MKRVLLVDDDLDILESLAMLLEGSYEVLLARNGKEALAIVESTAKIDVMVLDLMMPVLDGAGLMRELEARELRVPVIVVSAHSDVAFHAPALGAADYLTKPFSIGILRAAIARVTGGTGGASGSHWPSGGGTAGKGGPTTPVGKLASRASS